MTLLHTVSGFLGIALLASALVCRALRLQRLSTILRAAIALGAGALVFLPIGDLLIVEHVRGVIGDLSIMGQTLLGATVVSSVTGREMIDKRNFSAIMSMVAGAAIFLYPLALGLTYFDPYALGFDSPYFATVLLATTLTAWWKGLYWLVGCIVLATTCYLIGVLESNNLWDYLIDPLVTVYALYWAISRLRSCAGLSMNMRTHGTRGAERGVFRRQTVEHVPQGTKTN